MMTQMRADSANGSNQTMSAISQPAHNSPQDEGHKARFKACLPI
jgi:hypothetical protein